MNQSSDSEDEDNEHSHSEEDLGEAAGSDSEHANVKISKKSMKSLVTSAKIAIKVDTNTIENLKKLNKKMQVESLSDDEEQKESIYKSS